MKRRISFRPPGARYAHKAGELEGAESDAGILLLSGRSFALVMLLEGEVGGAAPFVSEALQSHCEFYAGAGKTGV